MEYIQIDKTSKEPIYLQLKHAIKIAIMNGTITHMHQLPTEAEICDAFHISVIVAKNAYDELVKEGLITRIKGKGTFVTTRRQYIVPLKFFYNLEQFSSNAKYELSRKLILFDTVKYQSDFHDIFNLTQTEYCHVAKIVIYLRNEPVILQMLYLPKSVYPNMDIDQIENHTTLEVLERYSKKRIASIKNIFKPYNLSSYEALLLKVEKDAAAHYVKSLIYDQNHETFAVLVSIYPSEITRFEVTLP
jgi:GntR family transcriptional regulator